MCVSDGRRSHVRRGSCGRCGRPAVAADHRQLTAVQQTQTLALRRTIHQPHQRGTNMHTYQELTLLQTSVLFQ